MQNTSYNLKIHKNDLFPLHASFLPALLPTWESVLFLVEIEMTSNL